MPARPATVKGAGQPCRSRNLSSAARPPRAFLDLGAVLTAPGCARAWTREILWEWGAAGLADAAEMVASELVTNSVNACTGLDRPSSGWSSPLTRASWPSWSATTIPGSPQSSSRARTTRACAAC